MRTFKLTIAYDGARYCGWQRQIDRPTVQGALEATLKRVGAKEPKTLASGRTDAGVHALGQVVGVRVETSLPADALHRALNAQLPPDIAVLELDEVDATFHPISDAVRKRYRYLIHDGAVRPVLCRDYCWHYRFGRLDAAAMRRAAERLLGRHDFQSYASRGSEPKTTVRTLIRLNVQRKTTLAEPLELVATDDRASRNDANGADEAAGAGEGRAGHEATADGDWIIVEAEADGFLYNMVRALVGSLVEVGRGARPETWPREVLEARDRCRAGPNAPPQGLFLVKVWYR